MPVFNLSKLMVGLLPVLGAYVGGQSVYSGSLSDLPASARMFSKTNFTESGVSTYTYTSTAVAAAAGGANVILPKNGNGYLTAKLVASAAGYVGLGLKTSNDGAQTYGGSILWSIYATLLTAYKIGIAGAAGITGNGASAAVTPLLGDTLKMERTGTTVTFSVARESAPTTWLMLHTLTGGSQEVLFPGLFSSAAGNALELGAFSGFSPYIPYVAAATRLVMDGNSLVYGYRNPGPGVRITDNLASDISSPLYATGATIVNSGTSGNTWAQMTAALPTFTANYINLCLAWEGTNSIANSRSGLEAAADAQTYITALRASNPNWRVVLMTALPRQGSLGTAYPTAALFNEQIDIYNAYLKANFAAMGAQKLIDVRPVSGVFDLGGDYSDASFALCDTRAGGVVWLEGANGRIHLTDFGDTVISTLVAPQLASITLR